ncbi:MAG TPA: cupin domain-containing protein [Caldimonas sp.]|nr:cupin domain-containing protein [Caldimonas sp.]
MTASPTPAAADPIRIGQIEIRYLQTADDGCGVGCFEMIVPPGAAVPPPHSHAACEELMYGLDGILRCTVGSETRDLGPGDVMGTPKGVPHAFSNPHVAAARVLVVNSPGIDPQYFRDIASIVSRGGPPDRALMAGTMHRYGLTPVAPPPGPPR